MSEFFGDTQIRATKFRALQADELDENRLDQSDHDNYKQCDDDQADNQLRRRIMRNEDGQNFTFEYSYPAVIFDNVNFSAERREHGGTLMHEVVGIVVNRLSRMCSSKSEADHRVAILKSINLNVPYGSIFGLLGPSSCGKTTLLRCLVGLLKPESGKIQLLCRNNKVQPLGSNKLKGSVPLEGNCRIPGADVGYMPQDLALYEDFNIKELLTMFGKFVGMDKKLIETRIKFMCQFLDLPETERTISTMSGGQKRRVSFAVACLHMPPLIILDEPTVGVDPMLRQSMWRYLRWLASAQKATIIITTHYIEEAAQADQVAFMRTGQILIQDTPANIMKSTSCNKLEDAFLKICLNAEKTKSPAAKQPLKLHFNKLSPQSKFTWHNELNPEVDGTKKDDHNIPSRENFQHKVPNDEKYGTKGLDRLKLEAQEKLALFDGLSKSKMLSQIETDNDIRRPTHDKDSRSNRLSMELNVIDGDSEKVRGEDLIRKELALVDSNHLPDTGMIKSKSIGGTTKLVFGGNSHNDSQKSNSLGHKFLQPLKNHMNVAIAIFDKNLKRNLNSIPLLIFQFMLPIVQMISFSLCVGGRPSNVGIGLVNLDRYSSNFSASAIYSAPRNSSTIDDEEALITESLSERYISFLDSSMLSVRHYSDLKTALNDVRRTKLWAAMEIGENFTTATLKRYDTDNINLVDQPTIQQSIIRIYPDRTNKVLNMVFFRSLGDSYRQFLAEQFEQFQRLPLEVKEPIFDIKPNLISNSIDGYTESIAAGLLASLTYIMAAGLTTFIMVVERDSGLLERTYTCGIKPSVYLLVHAIFRSFVMMIQVAVVLFLTFYVIQQPLVGSIWLAYLMLMILNMTGISFGLLISSMVTNQNGAALAIVSSLVFKITLSGILWPLEAVPKWLRPICYAQPMAMPVQALKSITLKGGTIQDRSVYMGFVVSIAWLLVFLLIAAKKFKFYQH